MTLAPLNVKASTEEDNDDGDGPALTMEKKSSNPSGEQAVKNIQSNENSENAAVVQEKETDHSVRQASAADEPAHTSTRTVERGDTVTEITRESAPQSSVGPSQGSNEAEIELERESESE